MYNANILKRKETTAAAKPLRPSDRLFRGRGRSVLLLPLLVLLPLPLLLLLPDVTTASAAVLLRRYCRAHKIYIHI